MNTYFSAWKIEEGHWQKVKLECIKRKNIFAISRDRFAANKTFRKTLIADRCSPKLVPGINSLLANVS